MALHVYARNAAHQVLGEIDDYTKLEVVGRYNAVGAWTIDLADSSSKANLLDPNSGNPGGGIQIYLDGKLLMSGPLGTFKWARSKDADGKLTAAGGDDNIWLADVLVWPDPAHAVTAQTTAFYSPAAAPAETLMKNLVNLNRGPGALVARRAPGLTVETDLGRGPTVTLADKRFEGLLDTLAEIGRNSRTNLSTPDGLGFRTVQDGTALQFEVYATADHLRDATFSFGLGNLTDASYTLTRPTKTLAILGAGREQLGVSNPIVVAQELLEYDWVSTSPYYPGVRVEGFVDVGQIDPSALDAQDKADQRAADELTKGAGQAAVTFKPVDTPHLRFRRDYQLGDYVTVVTPYLTLQEQVQEAHLTYTADAGLVTELTVGTDAARTTTTPGFVRRLQTIQQLMDMLNARR